MRQKHQKISLFFAVVAAAGLSGCGLSPEGNAVRAYVKDKGAIAADAGLDNATWFICNAATVGAVKRKFGQSPEKARQYADLCRDETNVIAPENEHGSGSD